MQRRNFFTIVVPGLVMASHVQAAKEVAPGGVDLRQAIQGDWLGREAGREDAGPCTLKVTGNSMVFQGAIPQDTYQATFAFVPGTDPQEMTATITNCAVPDYIGRTAHFICTLENGVLSVAGNEPGSVEAPKSFDPQPGTRIFAFLKAKG